MAIAFFVPVVILISVAVRARGLFSRQPLVSGPLRRRILVSLAVGVLVVALGAASLSVLLADVAGLALGAAFAWWAFTRTKIEPGSGGQTYLPDRWAAGAITVLFIGRIVYRLVELLPLLSSPGALSSPAGLSSVSLFTDPISSALFVLTFGYYATYCAALLRVVPRSA